MDDDEDVIHIGVGVDSFSTESSYLRFPSFDDCTCVVESDVSVTYAKGNTAIVGTGLPHYADLGLEVVAISPEAS